MSEKIEQLEAAKASVRWLLDHPNGLSEMKGLTYWSGRVEALREEIRAAL